MERISIIIILVGQVLLLENGLVRHLIVLDNIFYWLIPSSDMLENIFILLLSSSSILLSSPLLSPPSISFPLPSSPSLPLSPSSLSPCPCPSLSSSLSLFFFSLKDEMERACSGRVIKERRYYLLQCDVLFDKIFLSFHINFIVEGNWPTYGKCSGKRPICPVSFNPSILLPLFYYYFFLIFIDT